MPRATILTISSVTADAARGNGTDGTEAFLPITAWPQGRKLHVGDRLPVELSADGSATVDASSDSIVYSYLYAVVPELREGKIRIMGLARSPGMRTKVAVATTDEEIDPVLACIGKRANRIKSVVAAIGERVDIIAWSPNAAVYAAGALQPAKVSGVTLNSEGVLEATVPPHQMPTAVGEGGLNARLASELVGKKITVVPE